MSQLKFAAENIIWTEEQRDCVHFSDKSKFNLLGCDRRGFVRRSPKERYSPQLTKNSVKFGGGSVMVFSMISSAGTGPLVRLHSKINATLYRERLIDLVGIVYAKGLEDQCSIPDSVITKTLKMVLDTSLLNTQQYKVRIKGKVEQSRERSNALPYTSV